MAIPGSDEIALEFRFQSIFIGPLNRESVSVRSDDAIAADYLENKHPMHK